MTGQYPLSWPQGWPRTTNPTSAGDRFGYNLTIAKARDGLYLELARMGAKDIRLSSDLALRLDGYPRSSQRGYSDAGVAVYFTRNGEKLVLACDLYTHVEDNMRALALVIESMRRVERYGGDKMMSRVFTGFTALPPPRGHRARFWWHVLGVRQNATWKEISASYKDLAKRAHPDVGGDPEEMTEINRALQEAREQF